MSVIAVILLALLPCLAHAQAVTPTILWTPPTPITFPTPLSDNQYRIRVLAGPPVAVPLASAYNVAGITSDGTPFNNGGFDLSGWAFASELLGRTVTWQDLQFPIGPPNAADAVTGATIPLPAGNFASLFFLADAVNGMEAAHFTVRYTDGSLAGFDQTLSDWVIPQNYPGESLAKCMPSRHLLDGSRDLNSVCIYGYQLPLDPTRTVASFTLPANRNVLVLSAVLLPPAVPGTLTLTPPEGTVLASGSYTLSASFTPANSALFRAATATQPLTVNPPVPRVTPIIAWADPRPIPPGTPLGPAQLNATASAPKGTVAVPLSPYYRINALYADGTQYLEKGLDGTGAALSSSQLGSSLSYAGTTFPLGPNAVPDAAADATISLPAGQYAGLLFLGSAGARAELAQPFTVTYTDGTSAITLLSLSSWRSPQHFAGETVVAQTTAATLPDGSQLSGTFSVYGYQLPLDPTRTVASITLPPTPDVVLFAAALVPGTSFPVAGTFTYTPPAGSVPAGSMLLSTHFQPTDSTDLTPADATAKLIVGILDFFLTAPGGTTLTAHMGESPVLNFQVAPLDSLYASGLSFSLIGTLPPRTTVTFSPATLAPGAGPQTVQLTLHTQLLSGEASTAHATGWTFACATFGLFLLPWRRLRSPTRLFALCLACALLPLGCGSGYKDAVYPLTLAATDGTTTHILPITLHILASAQ